MSRLAALLRRLQQQCGRLSPKSQIPNLKSKIPSRRLFLESLEPRSLLTAGALDPTFGDGGHVMTDFTSQGAHVTSWAQAVIVQPDGKTVAAGRAGSGPFGQSDIRFAVARYDANGGLDPTFDGDGKVETFLGDANSVAYAVALQADGKLVVAGEANRLVEGNPDTEFALVRYNVDGSPDNTFGDQGKVITHVSDHYDVIRSVQIQPDGKIVVAGAQNGGPGVNDSRITVAHYNSDGTLDSGYGTGGFAAVPLIIGGYALNTLVLQSDGKAVVAGSSNSSIGIAVVRYDDNGALDASFGTGGISQTVSGNAYGAALQPDGKIVVGGRAGSPDRDFLLARYTSTGQFDASFGTAGVATTSFGTTADDMSAGVVIQSDGRIVGAGRAGSDIALARYLPDGSLDSSFGNGGKVIDESDREEEGLSIALAHDGNIVVAGISFAYPDSNFVLARYEGGSPISAAVDISPESLNIDSNGALTVLISGAANLDVSQILVSSVRFAGASAWQSTLVDANHDGRLDLQLKFRRQDATALDLIYEQFLIDDHDADGVLDSSRQIADIELTGELVDGALFSGSDDVTLFLAGKKLRDLLDRLFGP